MEKFRHVDRMQSGCDYETCLAESSEIIGGAKSVLKGVTMLYKLDFCFEGCQDIWDSFSFTLSCASLKMTLHRH